MSRNDLLADLDIFRQRKLRPHAQVWQLYFTSHQDLLPRSVSLSWIDQTQHRRHRPFLYPVGLPYHRFDKLGIDLKEKAA